MVAVGGTLAQAADPPPAPNGGAVSRPALQPESAVQIRIDDRRPESTRIRVSDDGDAKAVLPTRPVPAHSARPRVSIRVEDSPAANDVSRQDAMPRQVEQPREDEQPRQDEQPLMAIFPMKPSADVPLEPSRLGSSIEAISRLQASPGTSPASAASPAPAQLVRAMATLPDERPEIPAAHKIRRTSASEAPAGPGQQRLSLQRVPGATVALQMQPEPVAAEEVAEVANGPFEIIEESGEFSLQVRRSKLLRTKNNVYRTAVVDPQICDVLQFTPREVSIIGRSQGATHVTFWFEGEDQKPLTYLVRVVPDAEEMKRAELEYQLLEDMLGDLFPDSKVRLLVMADKLIVKGQAKDSEEASQIMTVVRNQAGSRVYNRSNAAGMGLAGGYAANVIDDEASGRNRQRQRMQVINMLRVPGVQQVALKVKIAELNRTAVRGFGLDVDGTVNFSNNPEGSAMFLQSMINVATGDTPALLTQFDGDDIRFGIRWLQQRGVLRLLSEPTLVTMSGRPATFVAGGEFAVPTVVGSVGLNAVTTDFRAFGVIISFMPIVLDKDRIRLEVAPEFSQINNQLDVGQTPGLNVRAVTTTVEMREGQTLAIAGLLEDTMAGNTTGNIPLLSQIFGRRDITRSETELIILVTPELVQAMEPEEVPPLPGFDVTEPNGKEFFLEGKLEGNPTREFRSTVWPRLKKRYGSGGPSMISGPFGHGQ